MIIVTTILTGNACFFKGSPGHTGNFSAQTPGRRKKREDKANSSFAVLANKRQEFRLNSEL
jgi:hypothetical protein